MPTHRPTPTVIVIPTIGTDHQFNLDYSVAHLAALLDAIRPGGVIVDDNTEWLANNCPLNASAPEIHVALRFARERAIPILGLRSWPPPGLADPFGASQRGAADTVSLAEWRTVLDQRTARIARDFTFATEPATLSHLVAVIFAEQERDLAEARRAAIRIRALALADSVARKIFAAPTPQPWVVLVDRFVARPLGDALRGNTNLRLIPVDSFLPIPAAAVERRLDRSNLAWILSSNLDEWYGMWAPQAFAGHRLSSLLRRLQDGAPDDPVTAYLHARWLMQHRDYAAAEPILRRIVESGTTATFPFPINGKWIRPPWTSVRRKAQLNLAFVLDYRGQRADALARYHELLALGEELDSEARAVGYLYDDIQSAVRSYVDRPYTGAPDEAFRHLRSIARRPACEPL